MEKYNHRLLFIANGKSKKTQKIERQLKKNGFKAFDIVTTIKDTGAVDIAAKACGLYSHIISIGGDGTLHEVINGVMQRPSECLPPVLGLIPGGTANDFAKTLGTFSSIDDLLNSVEKDNIIQCDVGEIAFVTENGEKKKRWFINIADAGIGAMVVNEVNLRPSKFGPNITFFRAIVRSLRQYRNIFIKCEADEWEWEGRIKMLVAANGKYFGSGLAIAPHAKINDGKLAVTIGGDISTRDYIRYLPALKRGETINHPQLFYKETKTLTLTSPQPCSLEADGEFIGYTPARIRMAPEKLNFIVPSTSFPEQ